MWCLPPLGGGGQDRAAGLGAAWHLEDACALVPSVLGSGPEPRGPLSRTQKLLVRVVFFTAIELLA